MKRERDFIIPFEELNISSNPKTSEELIAELDRILSNNCQDGFEDGRKKLKKEYFTNDDQTNNRAKVAQLIINKTQIR